MPRPPRQRILTPQETIAILHRLNQQSFEEISEMYEIPVKQVKLIRIEHNAISEEKTRNAIRAIENKIAFKNSDLIPKRDIEKQNKCIPKKIYFKCYTCNFVASENNLDGITEHLERCKKSLESGMVYEVNLLANVKI